MKKPIRAGARKGSTKRVVRRGMPVDAKTIQRSINYCRQAIEGVERMIAKTRHPLARKELVQHRALLKRNLTLLLKKKK